MAQRLSDVAMMDVKAALVKHAPNCWEKADILGEWTPQMRIRLRIITGRGVVTVVFLFEILVPEMWTCEVECLS